MAPAWAPVATISVAEVVSYAAYRWRVVKLDLGTQLIVLLLVWSVLSLARTILGPMRRCSENLFIQYSAWAAYYLQSSVVVCAVSVVHYSSDSNLSHVGLCVYLLTIDCSLLPMISTMSTYSPGDPSRMGFWLSIRMLYYIFILSSVAIKLPEYEPQSAGKWGAMVTGIIGSVVLPLLLSYLSSDCRLSRRNGEQNGNTRIVVIEPHQLQDPSFKDTALSYRSFKSLATQYFQLPCTDESEADQQLCHYFRGLLEYNRIFTIVERQLAILHGYLFDSYHSFHEYLPVKLMRLCPYLNLDGSLLLLKDIEWLLPSWVAGAFTVKEEYMYVFLLLYSVYQVIPVFQWQLILASDVWKAKITSLNHHTQCYRPMKIWFRLPYWQNKFGQYSIIKDCDSHSSKKAMMAWFKAVVFSDWELIFIKHHPVEDDPVMVPDSVRKFVAQALTHLIGPPTNGIGSPTWRKQKKSLHITILISHIATCYCDDHPPAPNTSQFEAYEVATVLSRYCSYLVAFLPDFLAEDNRHATRDTLQDVLQEAQGKIIAIGEEGVLLRRFWQRVKIQLGRGRMMSMEEKRARIQELNPVEEDEVSLSTFEKGVRLGKKLKGLEPFVPWNEIAKFWTEMIIFIATSENLAPHVEHLAKGGEFVTHVWALLYNAGIHDQVTEPRTLPQRLHDMATGSNTRREEEQVQEPRQDTPQPRPVASASIIGRDESVVSDHA